MKNLILAVTIAVTSFSAVQTSAGDCHIRPVYPPIDCHIPPTHPPIHCEVTLPPPPCYIRPIRPICPPPQPVCVIRPICPPLQPVCVIRPCEPVRPVCHIRPCEPVHPPVYELPPPTCTIRPCEPTPTCHCRHECKCHKICTISCVNPAPVYPVQPTYPAGPPPAPAVEIPSGQEVTIDGSAFGFQPGRVVVQINGLQLEAQITNWTNQQVRAVMPQLPLASATEVNVVVIGADGNVANQLTAQLVPAQPTPGFPASHALASR